MQHRQHFLGQILVPEPGKLRDLCAVLYGIGARLDQSPELLFTLRGVDHLELFSESTQNLSSDLAVLGEAPTLEGSDLAAVFGIELESEVPAKSSVPVPDSKRRVPIPRAVKAAKPRTKRAASGQKGAKLGKKSVKIPTSKSSSSTIPKESSAKKSTPAVKAAKARREAEGDPAVTPSEQDKELDRKKECRLALKEKVGHASSCEAALTAGAICVCAFSRTDLISPNVPMP